MLDIVGGCYYEKCDDPHWHELFGSGLRAINALANRGAVLNFHTYADDDTRETLNYFSQALSFNLFTTLIDQSIEFRYQHPLADPIFSPPVRAFQHNDNISPAKMECAIVFGMLEGNAKIIGKKVVYDPQNPGHTRSFKENGSEANELVIVLNLGEATNLAATNEPYEIAEYFFKTEDAYAVIIKMGAYGACLIKKDSAKEAYYICPFITEKVWPIGSGDIFTAVLGYEWMINNSTLEEAAEKASISTAYYVNSKSLPIPMQIVQDFKRFKKSDRSTKVYLAGPFFTMAQRWLINEFRDSLMKSNIEVFSPMHDVGFGEAESVAQSDLEGLKDVGLVLAIGDGLDAGTLFEIGYARSLNIPVLIFLENEKEESLTMLKGSGCMFVSDFSTAVYKSYWELYNDQQL